MTDQPITKVSIDTAGPTVTIEAAGDLETVAAKAVEVWERAMKSYPLPTATGAVGFANAERSSGPQYVSAHPVDMRERST